MNKIIFSAKAALLPWTTSTTHATQHATTKTKI